MNVVFSSNTNTNWFVVALVFFAMFLLVAPFLMSEEPVVVVEPVVVPEPVEFEEVWLRSVVEEFDTTLLGIMHAEMLLEIPNVEKRSKILGMLKEGQRKCRKLVSAYNAKTGSIGVGHIEKFEVAELPIRLSEKDCEKNGK